MTILELNRNIMALGLPKDWWSTDGEIVEGYMLFKRPNENNWIVQTYDPSRGPYVEKIFDSEDDACLHMYEDCKKSAENMPIEARIDALNYYKLIGAID